MDKDISTLLGEIKATTGWSEKRIAAKIGTSQPTVNRILGGQGDCKGSTLRAITELHRMQCRPPKARAVNPPPEVAEPSHAHAPAPP
jgi:predicted transcriptional regulator